MTMPKQIPAHILAAVAELSVACKGGKNDPDTCAIFAKYLADAEPKALALAVTRWCAGNTFFPSVAEIRAMLVPAGAKITAAEAWEEACGWVDRVGYCGRPDWSDPMVERAAVTTCGSWEAFCTSPTDQFMAKRAKFFDIFGQFEDSMNARGSELAAAKLLELSAPREHESMTPYELEELREGGLPPESDEDRNQRRWDEGAQPDDEGDV